MKLFASRYKEMVDRKNECRVLVEEKFPSDVLSMKQQSHARVTNILLLYQ